MMRLCKKEEGNADEMEGEVVRSMREHPCQFNWVYKTKGTFNFDD